MDKEYARAAMLTVGIIILAVCILSAGTMLKDNGSGEEDSETYTETEIKNTMYVYTTTSGAKVLIIEFTAEHDGYIIVDQGVKYVNHIMFHAGHNKLMVEYYAPLVQDLSVKFFIKG